MSFVNELKRRNVFRVGIAYVVTSWLLAQILEIVLESFETPVWVMKTVLVILAAGLPVALIFAWAFELTPEGIKKERDVDRAQSITSQTGRKLDFAIIAVLAVALGYFAYDKFAAGPNAGGPQAAPTAHFEAPAPVEPVVDKPKEKSIAVLPFVNMSEDAGNEYFSDGISEEILNALAKVKELKVAGRTSSFAFRGKEMDLRQIGETLGVEHILEGSVRKFENQVRITAQLIQVEDGFHLWSDSYDRELDNVFAIQDEIATAILQQLKATLLEGEESAVVATRTDSEAYDLYLLAKQRMYERQHLTLQSAAELLDRAIAIDPDYAPAYAQRGIAAMLMSITSYGDTPQDQARVQGKLYLDKALMLDEDLAEAWAGLGLYYNGPPFQPYKGIEALEKALSINPNLINASNWLVLNYWGVNRMDEALAQLDKIEDRDPLYKPAIGNRVWQLGNMGRGDEAREFLNESALYIPGDPSIEADRAWIDFLEGDMVAGLERMKTAFEQQPTDRIFRVGTNWGYYATHQFDRAFDDQWSDYYVKSLFNLGRTEEAAMVANELAATGNVRALFALLNASDQSELLIEYFEDRWPDIDTFEEDVPANGLFGYREMADIALAYRRAGRQARFDEAMAILSEASVKSLSQGMQGPYFLMVLAAYDAMSGDHEHAITRIAEAIDNGLIVLAKISAEYPYFRDLDGHPEYEAIQSRMIEHLNSERAKLGLEPVTT
jgi:TolB-like protein